MLMRRLLIVSFSSKMADARSWSISFEHGHMQMVRGSLQ
jgi:hypothetical protein